MTGQPRLEYTSKVLINNFLPTGRNFMSAKELCEVDDLCTTLVVDPLVRFKSHKMDLQYTPPDMLTHLLSLSIMLQFVQDGDLAKVYRGLYSLRFTQEFLKRQSSKGQEHVRDHLLRFIAMFRHEAGYTVVPCDRYATEGHIGGKLIATRYWKKDDVIEQLIGVIGNLTEEEESQLLKVGQNDFSVLMSQRKKRPQLWLGPGAFLNHDCNPNCQFMANEQGTAVVIVIKDISPGEELFIFYGPEFFGKNNENCECGTCEKKQLGAFRKNKATMPHPERNRRADSPTPSMVSNYTLDEDGFERRRYALRTRKQVTSEELGFDGRAFFQDLIIKRFINTKLITGNEHVSKDDVNKYNNLQHMAFRPNGLPAVSRTSPIQKANDLWDIESLLPVRNFVMEDFFLPMYSEITEFNITNLLLYLGLSLVVLDQRRSASGRIVNKHIAIGDERTWSKIHEINNPPLVRPKKRRSSKMAKLITAADQHAQFLHYNQRRFLPLKEALNPPDNESTVQKNSMTCVTNHILRTINSSLEEEFSESDHETEPLFRKIRRSSSNENQ